MGNNYRVHYRKGDVDIEVESTDRNYVDKKLQELISLSPKPPRKEPEVQKSKNRHTRINESEQEETGQDSTINAADVVAKIQELDNFDDIDEKIIKKPNQLPRILLSFYFAHKCGNDFITTGDVERITDQLGVKIHKANVGKCIKTNKKYFTAKEVRRRGAIVPYKLNRHGQDEMKKVLGQGKL